MATTLARSISNSNGHGRRHEASTTSSSSSSSTASAQKRRGESQHQAAVVPATPGPALQFLASPAHHHNHPQTQLVAPRRSVPSKWEDAEKWLRQSSSSSDSDHHLHGNARAAFSRQRSGGLGHRGGAGGGGDEKSAAVAVRRSVDALRDAHSLALYAAPAAEVLLKGVLWGFYLFIYLGIYFLLRSNFARHLIGVPSNSTLSFARHGWLQTSSPTMRSRPRRASCSGARAAARLLNRRRAPPTTTTVAASGGGTSARR